MFYDELVKGKDPERLALVDAQGSVTYGELEKRVDHWARFLQAQGLLPGERVGLFSRNCSGFVTAYLAVIRAGGVIVPLNFQLAPREVAYILKDAGISFLITRQPLELKEALAEQGLTGVRQFQYEELDAAVDQPLRPVKRQETDNCTIIYTSGTTGRPKGAMLTHRNLLTNARAYVEAVGQRPEDRVLCLLPMYHCYGWTVCVTSSLLLGNPVIIQTTYNFKTALRLVQAQKVTVFVGVPAVMELLVDGADLRELESVRLFISGGASLGEGLGERFSAWCRRPLLDGYGLSETSPVVSFNQPGHTRFGSIGLPVHGVEAAILGPDGTVLPPGQKGEIGVRGPNVMLGYLNLPEATEKAFRGGWFHTEDVGYFDQDGYLFLVDRLKDMIISSGENIYPREVEEAIQAYPGVAEAAVIGVPDPLRGQAVASWVVTEPGAEVDFRALRRTLLKQIAAYKVPKKYFLTDTLPRNHLGKLLKNQLRKQTLKILEKDRTAGRAL
ncbi:class I adenylate-forming enzyme family protein [Acidaminococcus sp.]|uniref:class I adenylate-forming enzyme family protein n=1 Tax=Acidaminococcus sp. TaxID=1872103 RepID=UPI003D7D7549